MSEENKKVAVERDKVQHPKRELRDRAPKQTGKSSPPRTLPTTIPQTKSEVVDFYVSTERDGVHLIVRVPHMLLLKDFSQQHRGTVYSFKQFDVKASGSRSSQTINIQIRVEGGPAQECYSSVSGKIHWITKQVMKKKVDVKKSLKNQYTLIYKHKFNEPASDVFFDLILYIPEQQSHLYKGIVNQGNTCYMNSYLQVLYHIQKFRQLIFDLQPSAPGKFTRSLQNMFFELTPLSSCKSGGTEQLSKSCGWTKRDVYVQQDIQQFSCLLLEGVQKKAKEQRDQQLLRRFHSIFQGECNNYIQCLDVDYNSSRIEMFQDIQLSVHNVNNLIDSLKEYFAPEIMEGDNIYKTDKFGPQRANKGIELRRLPQILTIHIKRFDFDVESEMHGKVMSRYEYPNMIDFSEFIKSSQKKLYKLYGVVVHDGSKCNSGHYYSFIKIHDQWYKFNDEVVTLASEKEVFFDNFGGTEQLLNFDTKQFKIESKQSKVDSTAYVLIYYNQIFEKQLFAANDVIHQWMLSDQVEKNKKMEQIQIQILDWVTIKKFNVSSCGVLLQIDSNSGGVKQLFVQHLKLNQSQTFIQLLEYVASMNGLPKEQIVCWIFENEKGKENFINPFHGRQNPKIGDLFKTNDGNLIVLLHKTSDLTKKLLQEANSKGTSQNEEQLEVVQKTQNLQISPNQKEVNASKSKETQIVMKEVLKPAELVKNWLNDDLILVIIKLYQINQNGEMSFDFYDYLHVCKKSKFSEIKGTLDDRFYSQQYKVFYYKQKRKHFEVSFLKENETILQVNSKNRMVTIVVERIHIEHADQDSLDLHLENLSGKSRVVFINPETDTEYCEYLPKNMSLRQVRELVFTKFCDPKNVNSADYINIKYRTQKKQRKFEETYDDDLITVKTLTKYEKTIHFNISPISIYESKHSAMFTVTYRNNFNFKESDPVKFVLPKTASLKQIMNKALESQTIRDCTYKDLFGCRLLLLDEKKTKIINILKQNDDVWGLLNKTKGHLILDGKIYSGNYENVFIISNKTKDGNFIGTPLVFEGSKQMLTSDMIWSVLDIVKKMKLEYDDKIHQINEKRLKILLYPSHLTALKAVILEQNTAGISFQTAYPAVEGIEFEQFRVDIIHSSIFSKAQAMRINLDD